jgi:hypothetical protein
MGSSSAVMKSVPQMQEQMTGFGHTLHFSSGSHEAREFYGLKGKLAVVSLS